jgi:hypothetical protein
VAFGAIILMDSHGCLKKADAKNALAFSQFQQARRRLTFTRDHFLFLGLTIGVHPRPMLNSLFPIPIRWERVVRAVSLHAQEHSTCVTT